MSYSNRQAYLDYQREYNRTVRNGTPNAHAEQLAKQRAWYKAHKPSHRFYSWKHNLKKNYGLTVEQYDEMWIEQAGMCAICHASKNNGQGEEFVVDHNHQTGAVRGLLCNTCNGGIGLLNDNSELLRAGASYLDQAM